MVIMVIRLVFLLCLALPLLAQTVKPESGGKLAAKQGPSADRHSAQPKDEARNRAEAWLRDFMAKNGIPGAVLAVSRPGHEPWIIASGQADVENHIPVRPDTVFRIGSVTKLFTAEAAARLAAAGKLDLDADIQRYAATFPRKDATITSRQLAGHLAGIRHYGRDDYFNSVRHNSIAENVKRIENDPLVHTPGSKYLYSSYGYAVLGLVIEGVAKQDFVTFLDQEIFTPLKMHRTLPDFNDVLVNHRARPYAKTREGGLINGPYMDSSDRLAAGGFVSSAGDLLRFGTAHFNDQLVTPEARALLFTTQKTIAGHETKVGMAWRVGTDSKGRSIYHHGGDAVGGRAFLLLYPDEKMAIVFVSNLTFAPFNEKTAEAVAELFRGQTVQSSD